MKLTKENIYIDLRGKSKKELTDLWEFLNSVGEKCYRDKEYFSKTNIQYRCLSLYCGLWVGYDDDKVTDKTEVTIEQLKEIIKPMENKEEQLIKEAKERGFLTEGNEFYSCFNDGNKIRVIKPYCSNSEINLYLDKSGSLRYYDGLNNEYNESLCSNPAIYKDGVWAEIVSGTLEQQLQKAEAEVKRLQSLIEEENKPKVGDWVVVNETDTIFKVKGVDFKYIDNRHCKITDQELINKLNELIK